MKVLLARPVEEFTEDFINIEVKKELGIRGDMIPYYLKNKITPYPTTGLFAHNALYCCKEVNGKVILTGTLT